MTRIRDYLRFRLSSLASIYSPLHSGGSLAQLRGVGRRRSELSLAAANEHRLAPLELGRMVNQNWEAFPVAFCGGYWRRINQIFCTSWLLVLGLLFGIAVPIQAVNPRISGIVLESDGRARVNIAADTNAYYILFRGDVVTDIRTPSQLELGVTGDLQLKDAQPGASAVARFYRVERVPLNAPKDSDGDGIDDVYELQHRTYLNPLIKLNPAQDTDGDGVTDLEEYRQGTDPEIANTTPPKVSLTAPTLGAAYYAPGFVILAATARATANNAVITRVDFYANKNRIGEGVAVNVNGSIQYQFKWDAVPVGEYVLEARVIDSENGVANSISTPIRVVHMATEPLTTLTSSPANGEPDVAVTRETILRFSCPLREGLLLDTKKLHAFAAGRQILSRVELSTDRRTATLFYLENLPSRTRVRVSFDGTGIVDCLGREIDADGDGQPGGVAQIDFDTLSTVAVSKTAVIGRVFASDPVPDPTGTTNFVNRPLKGVTITVDGAEETLRAVTDAQGTFRLEPAPTGRFFVHVDGRTADGSQWPSGAYYPFVGKAWDSVAGRTDNLANGTGQIFLPLVPGEALKPVSATEDTKITFAASTLAANPGLAGVSITVPANSLFDDNGLRGGRVGIAPVPPDRLPGPLPGGLEFPLVITVQTDGPRNFDKPVPVCFPNLPDPGTGKPLPPGTKNWLFSFVHNTGQWEPIGPMTVTADGRFICTDPGVGIIQPGWHGSGPPPAKPPPPSANCPPGANPGQETCAKRCERGFNVCAGFLVVGAAICEFYTLGACTPLGLSGLAYCETQRQICLSDCGEDNPCLLGSQPPTSPTTSVILIRQLV